jgi:hypothetical protein
MGTFYDNLLALIRKKQELNARRANYLFYLDAGLRKLRDQMPSDHHYYSEALTYEQALLKNIASARRFGDDDALKAARTPIIGRLNELALSTIGVSFDDLCGLNTLEQEQITNSREISASAKDVLQFPLCLIPIPQSSKLFAQRLESARSKLEGGAAEEAWEMLELAIKSLGDKEYQHFGLTRLFGAGVLEKLGDYEKTTTLADKAYIHLSSEENLSRMVAMLIQGNNHVNNGRSKRGSVEEARDAYFDAIDLLDKLEETELKQGNRELYTVLKDRLRQNVDELLTKHSSGEVTTQAAISGRPTTGSLRGHLSWLVPKEDSNLVRHELAEARENLRLIQERKAQFVTSTDVPLPLVKEERRLVDRIAELGRQLAIQPAGDGSQLDAIKSESEQLRGEYWDRWPSPQEVADGNKLLLAIPFGVLPVLDGIPAGQEKPISDHVIGYIRTDKLEFEGARLDVVVLSKRSQLVFSPDYDYVAVRVSGDSMDLAHICPDDYVVLRKQKIVSLSPRHRDIVAVVFRDEDDNRATLKRILIEPKTKKVTLKPESSNPKHKSRFLPPKAFVGENPSVDIVGIAVAVLKSYSLKTP